VNTKVKYPLNSERAFGLYSLLVNAASNQYLNFALDKYNSMSEIKEGLKDLIDYFKNLGKDVQVNFLLEIYNDIEDDDEPFRMLNDKL
jgi:hypothetical protein